MDQGIAPSLSVSQLVQQPAQLASEPSAPKKVVFGRDFNLVAPEEACSLNKVESRASSSFGILAVRSCTKADVSPLFSEGFSGNTLKSLEKAKAVLLSADVDKEGWEKRWGELQAISLQLKTLLDAKKGSDGHQIFSAIQQNSDLNTALVDLARREHEGEVDAMLQAMILDSRLTEYLELASHVKPDFDWRSVHSKIIETVRKPQKKIRTSNSDQAGSEKTQDSTASSSSKKMPCRPSLQKN